MRVTISRRLENPGLLTRVLFSTPKTGYIVSVSIEFSHEEKAIIEERRLGKLVMFTHTGAYRNSLPFEVEVDFFVKHAVGGRQGHFDFESFGDAEEFERTVRSSVADLKKYITATGNAGSSTDTFEL